MKITKIERGVKPTPEQHRALSGFDQVELKATTDSHSDPAIEATFNITDGYKVHVVINEAGMLRDVSMEVPSL